VFILKQLADRNRNKAIQKKIYTEPHHITYF